MKNAPASPSIWWWWAYARTSAARRITSRRVHPTHPSRTGRAAFCAPAMARASISPAGCSRACRHPPISCCRAWDGLIGWIDARFPLLKLWNEHLARYYAPKNFNFWYYFGSLAMLVLALQILTGIWLTMNYKPDADLAFGSVEYIMRDVDWGWLIRYMHSTGASAFFIVIYLHMFRGLMYGSYKKPRELLWIIGMLIYLTLMGEAFFGYLLPWGQMSYWGAKVIVSLYGAIPVIGPDLAQWIRGDYGISDVTLNRFFAFHVIAMPLILCGLVVVHIMALHEVGSNNP